ncbi:FAS1-like dehydratase domain-containing protein [Halomarina halobia]|uniref:MaoC family dehydratase N-terminal domain-containing protein n=1 Tax=Halomarina halobia TaxID=3033386 RepID=A0ABD6ADQ4_9EURY
MPSRSLAELEALVGTSVVTAEDLTVEAGKVEEFARAIGDDNPVYREEAVAADRGYDAVPAPLTFTRTTLFPRYRPAGVDSYRGFDLGFDPEYSVHGEQAYEFERPLLVGDVLTGTTTLTDVFRRDGSRGGTMTFAVLETEYRDADGELVVTEEATIIETGGAIAEEVDG